MPWVSRNQSCIYCWRRTALSSGGGLWMTVQVYILLILPCPPASPAFHVLLQTLPPSSAQVPSVSFHHFFRHTRLQEVLRLEGLYEVYILKPVAAG
jgi:hypothetical protein